MRWPTRSWPPCWRPAPDDRPARIYVNNGGDIALHLDPGARFAIAIAREDGADLGRFAVTAADLTRGIATSGRGGRSLSMGIADSVTLLAASAADATPPPRSSATPSTCPATPPSAGRPPTP